MVRFSRRLWVSPSLLRLEDDQQHQRRGGGGGGGEARIGQQYLQLLSRAVLGEIQWPQDSSGDSSEDSSQPPRLDAPSKLTMVSAAALALVQALLSDAVDSGTPGAFIECGAWRGGTSVFARGVLDALGPAGRSRIVFVADAFEKGFPSSRFRQGRGGKVSSLGSKTATGAQSGRQRGRQGWDAGAAAAAAAGAVMGGGGGWLLAAGCGLQAVVSPSAPANFFPSLSSFPQLGACQRATQSHAPFRSLTPHSNPSYLPVKKATQSRRPMTASTGTDGAAGARRTSPRQPWPMYATPSTSSSRSACAWWRQTSINGSRRRAGW